jgi:hypothetical protein
MFHFPTHALTSTYLAVQWLASYWKVRASNPGSRNTGTAKFTQTSWYPAEFWRVATTHVTEAEGFVDIAL